MTRGKAKALFVTALVGLAIIVFLIVSGELGDGWVGGRVRLPVGKMTPAISLGERHGLILASDGSLWSWGSDFLSWPVLGLGSNTMKTTRLRRIGDDTNWVSISAAADHNLAIKMDGTLWTWGAQIPTYKTLYYEPVPAAPGKDWKQAVAGETINAALKKDGTLWTWGNNWAGQLGTGSTNNSALPAQVGSGMNWVKVWAGTLETVGMQSDGSLWYWGENPDPAFGQGVNPIVSPKRVNNDTNWADVGFGTWTVFAIKTDGTLWVWGRNADRYTGVKDTAKDAVPLRVGTNSDWKSFCATAHWWINGLIKKDGSPWVMDASSGNNNGPQKPYQPVQFRRMEFQGDCIAYAAGATHAAGPGIHGPIEVFLTKDGEVWTRGMELGDPLGFKGRTKMFGVKILRRVHPGWNIPDPEPSPVYKKELWRLKNDEAN